MGSGCFDTVRYASYSTSLNSKSTEQVFTQKKGKDEFLPKNINFREARDNEEHPESTAIVVGVDVTGSMGVLADSIVRGQLGVLMTELLARLPVKDPQVCFMAIGDVVCDQAPLQVTQFESDDRIAQQITELWLEGHGGGNRSESYILPWYFALNHIKADCIEKRNKKGYIFTMGDEECPAYLYKSDMDRHMPISMESSKISVEELYSAVSSKYDVFHLIIEEGSHCRVFGENVVSSWQKVLGRKSIMVRDYRYLSQIIVSIIQINEGGNPEDVINSWEDTVVQKHLRHAFGI